MIPSEQPKGNHSSPFIEVLGEPGHIRLIKPPRLATANDVRELVQYLKRNPEGVNLYDVPQPLKKRIFYPTKIAAYESWGVVNVRRDRIALTLLGWEFARSLEPEARAYRDLIKGTALYRGALTWIQQYDIDLLTQDDLANYWQNNYSWALGCSDEKEVASVVITFFHLCQAAELGTLTIGKRGQPGRLRVWRAALSQHFDFADRHCPKTLA